MGTKQHGTAHVQLQEPNWSELPLPALKAIGRSLDINSCLSARLTCSSWCDGISSSVSSLLLTPALLASVGPEPLKRCLSRMAHLEHIDLALTSTAAAGQSRSYTAEHVAQLLQLVAEHCKQKKMPAVFAFAEQLSSKERQRTLSLHAMLGLAAPAGAAGASAGSNAAGQGARSSTPSWQQQGFGKGLAELGPKLNSLRISDPGLLSAVPLTELSQLEFLELNLHKAGGITWSDLAKLPALHSLMLSPPVSPSSSGLGPEHAQQVVPTLLSFSVPVHELLQSLASNPTTAGRMKQLLLQQTGTWDEPAVELLSQFTALEALRLFPGPSSPDGLWNNLAPVSKLSKLQELQLVGYSPVNFSNGSATGEALSAAMPALKALELLVEPESDQVAAIASLTQLTRLKLMMQPQNMADVMHVDLPPGIPADNAADVVLQIQQVAPGPLQGLFQPGQQQGQQQPGQQAPGQPGQQQQDQPGQQGLAGLFHGLFQQGQQAGQQAQQQQGQQHQEQGMQGLLQGLFQQAQPPQQQQQQQAGAAAADPLAGLAALDQMLAGMLNMNGMMMGVPLGGNVAAAAAAPGPPAAAGGAAVAQQPQAAPAAAGGQASGVSSSNSAQQPPPQQQQQRRSAAPAGLGRSGGLRRPAAARRATAVDGSSSSSGGVAAASGAAPAAGASRSSSSRFTRARSSRDRCSNAAGSGAGSGSTAAAGGDVRSSELGRRLSSYALDDIPDLLFSSDEESEAAANSSNSTSNDADLAHTAAPAVADAADTVEPAAARRATADGSSNTPGEASTTAAAGAAQAAPSNSTASTAATSDSSDDDVPSLQMCSTSETGSSDEARSSSRQAPLDESDDEVSPEVSDTEQAGDDTAQQDETRATAAAAEPANAAAPNAQQPAVQQEAGVEAAAEGGAAAAADQLPPAPGLWGLPAGALPAELTCLNPISELRNLQHLELLSPMIAITDAGLDPVVVGLHDTAQFSPAAAAAAASKAAGYDRKAMQPALPKLKALTLSGTIQITRQSYRAISQALPNLEELNLIHARPGDAPFDILDVPGVDQGLGGLGGLAGLGGLGGIGGLAGLGGLGGGQNGPGQAGVDVFGPFNMNLQVNAAAAAEGNVQPAGPAAAEGAAAAAADAAPALGEGQQGPNLQQALNQLFQQLQGQQQAGQQQQGQQQQQQHGMPPAVQIVMQVNNNPPIVLAGGGAQQQQQQQAGGADGGQAAAAAAAGQQQQGQAGGMPQNIMANIMQQVMQQLAGGAPPPAQQAAAAGQQPGNLANAQVNVVDLQVHQVQQGGGPAQVQMQHMQMPAAAGGAAAAPGQQPPQAQVHMHPHVIMMPPGAAAAAHHHHHHHHPFFGPPGGSDPSEYIAPTKISVEDLSPGLQRLQLVNVGIRSSKTPLPCPKLLHLQMERCKSARAFRVPQLSRCSKLTTLQLVNVYLEPDTIKHIADNCPALQRLCLTDYNAFTASAPVRSVSRVMPVVFNQQQHGQQQQGEAAGQPQQQQPPGHHGGFGVVSEVVSTMSPPQQRPDIDWSPLAALRCLVQLSLKSSSSHIFAAAQQLGQLKHTVKNLKLEAQGLKTAELKQMGEQLVILPHLTWLALVLQYKPDRPPSQDFMKRRRWVGKDRTQRQQQSAEEDRAAGADGGSSSSGTTGAGGSTEAAAAAAAAPAAQQNAGGYAGFEQLIQQMMQQFGGGAGNPAAAANAAAADADAVAAAGAGGEGGPNPGNGGSSSSSGVGWAWQTSEQLSKKLMQELPGTALELKIRPHGWF